MTDDRWAAVQWARLRRTVRRSTPARALLGRQVVLCVGLPRTGTTSLHLALQRLGIASAPRSTALADGDTASRDQLLQRYDAFSDLPVPFVVPQLLERFPDAVLVATWRPLEPWLESMEWLLGPGRDALSPQDRAVGDQLHERHYGTVHFDHDRLSEVHRRHAEQLDAWSARPELRMVSIRTDELGWEPLCVALGRRVPRAPFPHAHRRRSDSD